MNVMAVEQRETDALLILKEKEAAITEIAVSIKESMDVGNVKIFPAKIKCL
jgi:hypothetical protein